MLSLLLLACSDSPDPTATITPTSTTSSSTSSPNTDAVQGTWSFAEECGESAGGTPISIQYSLTVSESAATLNADGYQTMMRIIGTMRPVRKESYVLVFKSTGDGAMFPDAYTSGQALLSLSFDPERSEPTLLAKPLDLVLNCTETMVFTR